MGQKSKTPDTGSPARLQHLDPDEFDAAEVADLWFMASFDLRIMGRMDGRMVGVVYGSDLDDGAWYPCISMAVCDERHGFSMDHGDAVALAAECERRTRLPEIRQCADSLNFYEFYAAGLRQAISDAAARNSAPPPMLRSALNLFMMTCVGTASAMMFLKVDAYHDRVLHLTTQWDRVLTFFA